MMRFIYQYQLERIRVELRNAITRYDTLYACHCDVCMATCMHVPHLDFDLLFGIRVRAVFRRLLDKLLAMSQDQRLCRMFDMWFNAIDQTRKDDLVTR